MPALKVLVFDYASPASAQASGVPNATQHGRQMMRAALLDDLSQVPDIELITQRAPASFWRDFDTGVQVADAVWPLAPTTGGMLERLSRRVLAHQRILLGSHPHAVRVAASRLRTSRILARAGIDVVSTYASAQPRPRIRGAWMVTPDDGADYDDTRIFSSDIAALAWIAARPGYVLQPFIPGKLGCLSLLCRDGTAELLACNEQRIAVRDNQFHLLGTTVNSLLDADGAFARLGQAVARALPGLWGHVGIEFVLAEQGLMVLALHARMTPSYAGLHASIGCNPAAMVLDLLAQPPCALHTRARPVTVSVDIAAFSHK